MATANRADARVLTRAIGTGGQVLALVTERVRKLRDVDHPGVLTPVSVGVSDGDQVVVTVPWLDGVDLAELETRRGPLTAGECVWLGVRVAQALEALHTEGLAHGDVSPSNVVITGDRVVLVDTVAGCLNDEHGTVGFRAPERVDGASAASDAYSLGALLRWCVSDAERTPIEAWTAPLVVPEPQSRPPVHVSAVALASCAREQAVAVPARTEIATALRARAADRTVRIAAGRPWRWRRAALRAAMGVGIATAAVALFMAVPHLVDLVTPATASAAATTAQTATTPSPVPDSPQRAATPATPSPPDEAAADLTMRRFEALAAGDAEALLGTVGSGPITSGVVDIANALRDGELVYEGLDVAVEGTEVINYDGDSAVVQVAYEVTDHRVVTGPDTVQVAGYAQRVELDLSWDGAWTVQAARPTP